MEEIKLAELSPFYAFVDPHGGDARALKATSSRAAIVVGATDALGRIFVFHAWAGRIATPALMDRILAVNTLYKPKVIGVEADGLAGLFGDAIVRDAQLRNQRLPLKKVNQPKTLEKDNRIRTTLQSPIAHGKLFLLGEMHELRHEITTFPMNPRKDLIDALASLVRELPAPRARAERDRADDAKLAYLRSTGAPAWYIEQEARHDRSAPRPGATSPVRGGLRAGDVVVSPYDTDPFNPRGTERPTFR